MFIGIWLTTGCNLRCRYCYEGTDKSATLMNMDIAMQCVNYIRQIEDPLVIIQFHGGEPLLNYDILRFLVHSILVNKGNKQKIMFGITTNATLLDDEKITFLSKYMDYGFSISIDGIKKVNDSMRIYPGGGGTYDSIIDKVQEALKVNPNIRLRMTFTSQTVSELSGSVEHLISIGGQQIVSIPDYFDRGWTEETMAIYRQQLSEIERMYREKELSKSNIEITLLENFIFKKLKCTGGYDSIHISPEGHIFPCIYVVGKPKYKIGTLDSGIMKEKLHLISQVNDLRMDKCSGCSNYESCNAVRCRYLNELLTGNCMEPSPVICAFEHENINFLTR